MTITAGPSETVLEYSRRLQERTADRMVELYAPDAEIVPDQLPSLSGSAAIRDFYRSTFEQIELAGDLEVRSERISGDLAIVRTEEHAHVTTVATGVRAPAYFREIFVLRLIDGRWLIQNYVFSQNPGQALS